MTALTNFTEYKRKPTIRLAAGNNKIDYKLIGALYKPLPKLSRYFTRYKGKYYFAVLSSKQYAAIFNNIAYDLTLIPPYLRKQFKNYELPPQKLIDLAKMLGYDNVADYLKTQPIYKLIDLIDDPLIRLLEAMLYASEYQLQDEDIDFIKQAFGFKDYHIQLHQNQGHLTEELVSEFNYFKNKILEGANNAITHSYRY